MSTKRVATKKAPKVEKKQYAVLFDYSDAREYDQDDRISIFEAENDVDAQEQAALFILEANHAEYETDMDEGSDLCDFMHPRSSFRVAQVELREIGPLDEESEAVMKAFEKYKARVVAENAVTNAQRAELKRVQDELTFERLKKELGK